MAAHAPTVVGDAGKRSRRHGPDLSVVPRTVSSKYIFDCSVNGRTVQQHPRADATNNVTDTDFGLIALDAAGAQQTFNAVRYPSYTQSADGSISTGAYDAVIAAVTWLAVDQGLSPTSIWRLGEPSGTTVADAQSANAGTYIGAPTLAVAGPLTTDATTAATFTSGTSYARIKQNSTGILRGRTNWSVDFWIKTSSTNSQNVYVERDTSGSDILRCEFNNGLPVLTYRDTAGTLNTVNASGTQYNDGAWHQVTFTKSGTAILIYVDGVQVKSGTLTATSTQTGTAITVAIGHDPTGDPSTDTQTVADVSVYPATLTAAQIALLRSVAITPSGTANTISVRAEFRRMSRSVIRKRIHLTQSSAAYSAAVRICDGFVATTTAVTAVGWDDILGSNGGRHMTGWTLHTASANGNVGFGIGIPDAYLNGRQLSSTDTAIANSSNLMYALVGNNAGTPAYVVSTTEQHVDVFYWSGIWTDTDSRRRVMTMCLADAQDVERDQDDVVRLSAVCARACKSAASTGSTTPAMHDSPVNTYTFPRGNAFGLLGVNDHAYACAQVQRDASLMSVNGTAGQTATGCVPDSYNDDGSIRAYNYSGDSNALVLLIAYWLSCHAMSDSDSASINGLTGTQVQQITDFMIAADSSGFPTFTRGGFNLHNGHYDWYTIPSSITHFSSSQLAGYYACGLIAAKRMGYAPAGIDTKIANATAAYQSFYDATLGHLRFLKDTDAGTFINHASLLDLLPEWWAVNVLGVELLGSAIAVPSLQYIFSKHTVTMVKNSRPSGRALRLWMQDGGTDYVPQADQPGVLPGTYVNGGSQFLFDFTTAHLGRYYGLAGMREFWADRKVAEINLDFAIHEAFTTIDPSPDPTTNPYNGRNGRTFPWNGIISAYEPISGLV